jgi:HK97 family phage prohead protease/HK97 family phage major capsid protein
MANNVEKRFLPGSFEVRTDEGKPTVVEGYAAVFNDETVIGGSFAERIDRGAFDGADMSNTVALFNHDINKPLARAGHGLELTIDERGLKYRFEVGNQSYAKDLVENIRMGNVSTSSFGFTIKDDEWEMRDGLNLRTIKEVDLLFDVSPTTQGAYPTTEVGLRSMELAMANSEVTEIEEEEVRSEELVEEVVEEEVVVAEAEEADEEDCGCEDKVIQPVPRSEEVTLETADAPVAEESDKIIERGAESEISMNEEKNAPAVVQGLGDKVQNVRARFDLGKAIREAATGSLSGLEAEMNSEAVNEFRQAGISVANGINIPAMMLRADAVPMATETVSSVSAAVNQGVQTDVGGPIANYRPVTFADKMGVRRLTGLTGDVSIPVQSGNVTASEASSEAVAIDSTNISLSSVTLSPDRLSAHTKVSQQLLAQNSFDLQAFLADDIRRGLELQYNTKLKNVIEAITETDGTDVDAADVPYLLEEALRDAGVDYEGAYFLMEAGAFKTLRRATLDAGSGLMAAPDRNNVIGYPALVSSLFTDDNVYMVQPADLAVAEWGGINIMVDPYTEAHKDVVRIVANMYVDCAILRAAGVKGYTNLGATS